MKLLLRTIPLFWWLMTIVAPPHAAAQSTPRDIPPGTIPRIDYRTVDATELPASIGEADFGQLPENPSDQPHFLPLSTAAPSPAPDTTSYGQWDQRFGIPGLKGEVFALATAGSDIFVGGNFTVAGGRIVNNIAMWNGNSWQSLGYGVEGTVHAIAVSGDNVYVGGAFINASGLPANKIAVWSRSKKQWSSLGEGVGGHRFAYVAALAVSGGDLYVGGRFLTAGRIVAVNIAKWDGQKWSRVGGGANSYVFALTVKGNDLYVGGRFSVADDKPISRIARVNRITNEWTEVADGVRYKDSGFVSAIAVTDNDLYIGGKFYSDGQGRTVLNSIAWYDAQNGRWASMSDQNIAPFIPMVYSLVARGSQLYVGGLFPILNGIRGEIVSFEWHRAYNFARWDRTTKTWSVFDRSSEIPNAYQSGVANIGPQQPYRNLESAYIAAMTINAGGNLVMGGSFNLAGPIHETIGVAAASVYPNQENIIPHNICTFDGQKTWGIFGSGIDGPVYALFSGEDNVLVGGSFKQAGMTPVNNIVQWTPSTGQWSKFGNGLPGTVRAVTLLGTTPVAGGAFTSTADPNVENLRQWNGTAWISIGASPFTGTAVVRALAARGSELYAGGTNGIYKWDGSVWSPLGGNVNGTVNALAVNGDRIYVGGEFTLAGSTQAQRIAVWDAAAGAWEALGSGANGAVNALAVNGDNLYAVGRFTSMGSATSANVAVWKAENQRWERVGDGIDGPLYAVTVMGGSVFVGGSFQRIGYVLFNSVARWDGNDWYDVDRGVLDRNGYGDVFALAAGTGAIYAGGDFQTAGGTTSYYFGRWSNKVQPVISLDVEESAPVQTKSITVEARPNPADATTRLSFTLESRGRVRLNVYDVQGREVARPIDAELEAGPHAIGWDRIDLPQGFYMYRLESGTETGIGRLLIVR